MASEPSSLLSLVAVSFPLVALVSNLAINTVDDDTGFLYRLLIGSTGIAAIASAAIGTFLAIFGYHLGEVFGNPVLYIGVAYAFAGIGSIATVLTEISEGMDQRNEFFLLAIIMLVVVSLHFIFNLVGL